MIQSILGLTCVCVLFPLFAAWNSSSSSCLLKLILLHPLVGNQYHVLMMIQTKMHKFRTDPFSVTGIQLSNTKNQVIGIDSWHFINSYYESCSMSSNKWPINYSKDKMVFTSPSSRSSHHLHHQSNTYVQLLKRSSNCSSHFLLAAMWWC